MTPEELDEARAKEAERICDIENSQSWTLQELAIMAARLARENWTPPEPEVDPDVLAWREWLATSPWHPGSDRDEADLPPAYRPDGMLCQTFLAGARMAREQERERAKVLVEFAVALETFGLDDSISAIPRGAREVLAKYRGEA